MLCSCTVTPQDWTGAHFVEAGTSSTKRGFISSMVYSEPMNMLVLSVEIRRAGMLKPNEVIDYEIDLGDFPSFVEPTVEGSKKAALQLLEEDTPFHVERNEAGSWTFTVIDQEWRPFDPSPPDYMAAFYSLTHP